MLIDARRRPEIFPLQFGTDPVHQAIADNGRSPQLGRDLSQEA
jgi:hypothetical protein